jgi:4-hydroxy-2-oxoheptanedioate aldolase
MPVPANPFKRALRAGRPQIGLWSSLASPLAAEVVAGAGFDWLLLDMEHAPNELPTIHAQLQAVAAGGGTHPIVRPPWNDMVVIKRLLDLGVQSLLIPYVQSAEEARQAVAATRYPPHGVRGFATGPRANRYGRIADYVQTYADELCVLVQVETRQGLENLEAIAAVDGVDGVFIGPADLAAALGHAGELKHPEVQAAIEDAIGRLVAVGRPAGILTGDEALARRYLQLGCLFTAVGADLALLRASADALAARFKGAA